MESHKGLWYLILKKVYTHIPGDIQVIQVVTILFPS